MPLSFVCPLCEKKLVVAEDLQGQQIRCPKCAGSLRVPGKTTASASSAARIKEACTNPTVLAGKQRPTESVRAKPQTNKTVLRRPADRARPASADKPANKSGPSLLIIGLVAGLAVVVLGLVLVGGLVFWMMKRSPDEGAKAQNSAPAIEQPLPAQPQPVVQQPLAQPLAQVTPAAVTPAQPAPVAPLQPTPVVQLPQGPAPSQIAPEVLRKVKQATVFLHVNLPNGSAAEGSGFLCAAPGIVITNAHVLGMLRGDSVPPTRVDVVLHSGESDEKKTTGTLLGVDRTNDLAVLRLPNNLGTLPEPLAVDSATKLIETQKVYIFGFPLGSSLGKNITVSESSVSSLRRDGSGVLNEVQVNGGMQPGNSGGPVTDSRGVVVGVSVSIIRGTQLNFAIPGDLVQQVLDGRFAASEWGTAYKSGTQVLLPVKMTCLDPLGHVRELKVEIGSGAPGEGSHTTVAAVFQDGSHRLEVPLPGAGPGQAYWIQPVLVKDSGRTERAKAIPVPAEALVVLERKPVLLQFKAPRGAMVRTLQLDSDVAITVYKGKDSATLREKMAGKVLESLSPDPRGIGTFIRLTLADCPFTHEVGDKKSEPPPMARAVLAQFSPTFLVDTGNACKERGKRNFNVLPPALKDTLEGMYETACNTYESTTLPLPNRMVNPQESWQTRMPMFVLARGKRQVHDIFVTCTYEGVHATATGGGEAHIAISGVVKGRGARAVPLGKARGEARFDVEKGFLTLVHVTVSTEVENEESGVRVLVKDQSIVRRQEGNVLGIMPATRNQPAGAVNQPSGPQMRPGNPRVPPTGPRRMPRR